jgi:hypothetical protein
MEAHNNEATYALKNGSIKIRVKRSGMYQQLTFKLRVVQQGNISYAELYTDRMVDTTELIKVAEEIGLPVEAQNGKAFPKGKSAIDFSGAEFVNAPGAQHP